MLSENNLECFSIFAVQQALNKWWVYTIEAVPSLKKKSLFRSSAYHFKRFILRCTTFQVVRILLQYCFCFIFWDFFSFLIYLFWWKGIWDLSSPTRDPAHIPCIGRRILNHWTTGEVPGPPLLNLWAPPPGATRSYPQGELSIFLPLSHLILTISLWVWSAHLIDLRTEASKSSIVC